MAHRSKFYKELDDNGRKMFEILRKNFLIFFLKKNRDFSENF